MNENMAKESIYAQAQQTLKQQLEPTPTTLSEVINLLEGNLSKVLSQTENMTGALAGRLGMGHPFDRDSTTEEVDHDPLHYAAGLVDSAFRRITAINTILERVHQRIS